jgi:hypothetical protein
LIAVSRNKGKQRDPVHGRVYRFLQRVENDGSYLAPPRPFKTPAAASASAYSATSSCPNGVFFDPNRFLEGDWFVDIQYGSEADLRMAIDMFEGKRLWPKDLSCPKIVTKVVESLGQP